MHTPRIVSARPLVHNDKNTLDSGPLRLYTYRVFKMKSLLPFIFLLISCRAKRIEVSIGWPEIPENYDGQYIETIFVVSPEIEVDLQNYQTILQRYIDAYYFLSDFGIHVYLLDVISSQGRENLNADKKLLSAKEDEQWISRYVLYSEYWREEAIYDYKDRSIVEKLIQADFIIYFDSPEIFNRAPHLDQYGVTSDGLMNSRFLDPVLNKLINKDRTLDEYREEFDFCENRPFAYAPFANISINIAQSILYLLDVSYQIEPVLIPQSQEFALRRKNCSAEVPKVKGDCLLNIPPSHMTINNPSCGNGRQDNDEHCDTFDKCCTSDCQFNVKKFNDSCIPFAMNTIKENDLPGNWLIYYRILKNGRPIEKLIQLITTIYFLKLTIAYIMQLRRTYAVNHKLTRIRRYKLNKT